MKNRSRSLREYLQHELKALKNRMKNKKRRREAPQQSYGKVSKTLKGDLVRSRAEKRIADFLFRYNIRYEYEPTLQLGGTRVKPDFYLPEQEVYVEFWGLMSKTDYVERMRWKLNLYQQFQVNILSLFQADLCNMEKCLIKKF